MKTLKEIRAWAKSKNWNCRTDYDETLDENVYVLENVNGHYQFRIYVHRDLKLFKQLCWVIDTD